MTHGRWRQDPWGMLLVLVGLAGFVAIVYLAVVVGGGALIGHASRPQVGLSILATAIVALCFEPVQRRIEQGVARLLHGGRQTPYEVLGRFSEAVSGATLGTELPRRMARVLAEGTGAAWAQVWIVVHDQPVLAATHPVGAGETSGDPPPWGAARDGQRTEEVRRGGELLGVLRLQERDDQPLTPVEERLFGELADQAGLALHGVRLRADLATRAVELTDRAEELRQSRERLVDAQDTVRRRLERDIHDGAQQHLVALAVNLRLAETLGSRAPDRAARVLHEQVGAIDDTIETLSSLAHGIYPRALTEEGLGAALRSVATLGVVSIEVNDTLTRRHSPETEAAVYFCALEALQNAAKHSAATRIRVGLRETEARLEVAVADDGRGFDLGTASSGSGLANMRDRIDSLGGSLSVRSGPVAGTTVEAWVPAPAVTAETVDP